MHRKLTCNLGATGLRGWICSKPASYFDGLFQLREGSEADLINTLEWIPHEAMTGLLKVKRLAFDDLDAGADDADSVRSLVHGEPPVIKTCSSQAAAAEEACSHIKNLIEQNSRPEAICFVARTRRDIASYERQLKKVCPAINHIKPSELDDGSKPGLRLAAIHRVKGLELDHVIIVDRLHRIEVSGAEDDSAHQERALLYVAATRARRSLLVCRLTG